MALFWHGVFATGYTKLNHPKQILGQIAMFRRYGWASFHTLLVESVERPGDDLLVDNKDSHKAAINENYGRNCWSSSRWGLATTPRTTSGSVPVPHRMDDPRCLAAHRSGGTRFRLALWAIDWQFDTGPMTTTPRKKPSWATPVPSTAWRSSISSVDSQRRPGSSLGISYNFFVADEPQVPAWQTVPPHDPEAIQTLMDAFTHMNTISARDAGALQRRLFQGMPSLPKSTARGTGRGTARLAGGHHFPTSMTSRWRWRPAIWGNNCWTHRASRAGIPGQNGSIVPTLMSRVNFARGNWPTSTSRECGRSSSASERKGPGSLQESSWTFASMSWGRSASMGAHDSNCSTTWRPQATSISRRIVTRQRRGADSRTVAADRRHARIQLALTCLGTKPWPRLTQDLYRYSHTIGFYAQNGRASTTRSMSREP